MRRAAILIAAAGVIAGCGATVAHRSAHRPLTRLCVDVGLPLSGVQAAAGQGVLAGLQMEIPAGGLRVGGYRVAICRVADNAAGPAAALAHARRAADARNTIAYVGGLSGTQANVAAAVLAQAGIGLMSPSGAVPMPALAPGASATAGTAPLSELFLLPSARIQAAAVAAVQTAQGCDRRRRGRLRCRVFAASAQPLCTGLPAVADLSRPRYCVLAGRDLSRWPSPARAYGATIGEILVDAFAHITQNGGDLASRARVLASLSAIHLHQSPIGPVSFDAAGAVSSDLFSAYTVRDDGQLVLSQTLRTH